MPVVAVFVLGSVISVLRIVATNRDALTTLVWAEDGLFPLCIQAHGYLPCLIDPYEGYFLFLSRTIAAPIALFPQPAWPLVTNIVAALTFGALSALITWLLLRAQVGRVVAVGAGLSAVLVPVIGLEAINTYGSAYMLLLIAAAIAVSFTFTPTLPLFVTPLILFVSAITIPSSGVLLLPLVFLVLARRQVSVRPTLLSIGALVLGLVIQFYFILTAPKSRSVAISVESIQDWLQQFPKALLTLVPSYSNLDMIGQLENSIFTPNIGLGLVALGALSGFAVYLISRTNPQLRGAGWLIVSGYLMGMIPAISGYPINRYFVIPVISLVIALLIVLGQVLSKRLKFILPIVIVGLFLIWLPDFGASKIRTTPAPSWVDMMAAVQLWCTQDPAATISITFSPDWPFPEADFRGPTTNVVQCGLIQYQ